MFAKERGRSVRGALAALALTGLGVGGSGVVLAQGFQIPFGKGAGRASAATRSEAKPDQAQTQTQTKAKAPAQGQAPAAGATPRLVQTALPVNPSDPIAIINKQVITRAQLADECVSRKGEEILETVIARTLIEQAMRARKIEVTAAEVDQEIDNVAMRVAGLGREAWLRTLDKERGISPIQYARDIIYPALALRKLAAPRVQVTPLDLKQAFEAQYGDKLRVRMIMVDKVQTAKEIWEELKKNPGGFEKIAMERSMDSGSRSLGGLLAEPISRHAYPQTVSDSAFSQLVDGDPKDTDPDHKPKDGDFTGPIQVAGATWVILRRESLIPAQDVDPTDERIKKQTHEMIYEVKLKEAMGLFMNDLMQSAEIDNKLTGHVKMANEPAADGEVKLMGGQRQSGPSNTATVGGPAAGAAAPAVKTPTPAALSPEVAAEAKRLARPPAAAAPKAAQPRK